MSVFHDADIILTVMRVESEGGRPSADEQTNKTAHKKLDAFAECF